MAAAKKTTGQGSPSEVRPPAGVFTFLFGRGRVFSLAVLGCAALFGAWYATWNLLGVGHQVLANRDYFVGPHDLEITPLPKWIHTDLRAEVYREASIDGPLWIIDDNLVTRIRDAFALQPWVRRVVRVQKHHPARVEVELEYRQPVCMVEVPGGLYAVDVEGAWLPWPDFTPVEASQYPRLVGINTMPVGAVGTRWGDARVVGGAEIAASLAPVWDLLQLHRIVPSAGSAPMSEVCTFDLYTRAGTRILWGHAPGQASAGETPPQEKVARLRRFADEHGSLDGSSGQQDLDVRGPGALEIIPRTADKARRTVR